MKARQPLQQETATPSSDDRYLAVTHEVFNQPPALEDYNLFEQDKALQEAVAREGAAAATSDLKQFGAFAGAADTIALGFHANENKPAFNTHDRFGHRTDQVDFHPAYHQLMSTAMENGLHSCRRSINPQTTGTGRGLGKQNPRQ